MKYKPPLKARQLASGKDISFDIIKRMEKKKK